MKLHQQLSLRQTFCFFKPVGKHNDEPPSPIVLIRVLLLIHPPINQPPCFYDNRLPLSLSHLKGNVVLILTALPPTPPVSPSEVWWRRLTCRSRSWPWLTPLRRWEQNLTIKEFGHKGADGSCRRTEQIRQTGIRGLNAQRSPLWKWECLSQLANQSSPLDHMIYREGRVHYQNPNHPCSFWRLFCSWRFCSGFNGSQNSQIRSGFRVFRSVKKKGKLSKLNLKLYF